MKRVVVDGRRRLEYTLIQAARKNVLFQALPEGQVRVYAPKYMRLRDVDAMVRQRIPELQGMLEQVEQRVAEERRSRPAADGSPLMIEGVRHTLRLHAGKRVSGRAENGEYHLTLPDPDDEDSVRAAARACLSEVALERIREHIAFYAPRLGVQCGRVTIREQKSRWGSCSRKGNLNFNWKLITAPKEVLEYVVIHELCHLIEFNHSPRFWALVESQMRDYEAWKKWLKRHGEDLGV